MNRAALEAMTGVSVRNGCQWVRFGVTMRCPFLAVCTLIQPTGEELLCEEDDAALGIPVEQVVDTWGDNTSAPLKRAAHPLARFNIDPTDEQWSKRSMSRWFEGTGGTRRRKKRHNAQTDTR